MTRAEIIETMAESAFARREGDGGLRWETIPDRWKQEYRLDAEAALSAIEAAGLVVVPAWPTPAMVSAAANADELYCKDSGIAARDGYAPGWEHYRAMIEAGASHDH